MKIKKKYQGSLPENRIFNTNSSSQTDTYSCDYINDSSVVVSAIEPTGNNRKKIWMQKGKNLLDISKLVAYTSYGITFTPTETGINVNGTSTDTYAFAGKVDINLKKGITYTLKGNNAGNTLKVNLLKKDRTTIITSIKTQNDVITFTPTEDVFCIQFLLEGITKSTNYNYEITNIQIVQGSTVAEYETYIEDKIYIKNKNDIYEEFKDDEEIKKELKEKNYIEITKDLVSALSYNTSNLHDLQALRLNYSDTLKLNIDGTEYSGASSVVCFSIACSDNVNFQLGVVTWCGTASVRGKIVYRYSHGAALSNSWKVLN